MTWWRRATLVSVVFVIVVVGAAFFTTKVLLAGKITPRQDEVISQTAGSVCGFGIVLTWVVAFQNRKKGE